MSIIERARRFMGDHGVTVRHVSLEGRAPAAATLALVDGGLRGSFAIATERMCAVRGRRTEVFLEIAHTDGRLERVAIGGDAAPTDGVEPALAAIRYPFELAPGFAIEDAFDVVFDGSLETLLRRRRLVVGTPVRCFVRTLVDVRGSPFDPEALDELPLALA